MNQYLAISDAISPTGTELLSLTVPEAGPEYSSETLYSNENKSLI